MLKYKQKKATPIGVAFEIIIEKNNYPALNFFTASVNFGTISKASPTTP